MAVKRLTIELDDVPDAARETSLPPSLIRSEKTLTAASTATTTPDQQADYQQQEATLEKSDVAIRRSEIGRTPSDLVFAFLDKPEFMATALTIIAFIIFASKIATSSDFKLPLVASVTLNAVWFGIRIIRYVKKWFLKKSS